MSASQFVGRSAQEHLLYIQEKVNPILEALVTAVLLERPEDPAYFMLKWLCDQTKSSDGGDQQQMGLSQTEEIEKIRAEISKLTSRKSELLNKRSNQIMDKAGMEPDKEEEEEEEESDDEGPDEPLPPPPGYKSGPRQSVSAEAYGDWNKKKVFTAPQYEKTPEQKSRIVNCLSQSFLFMSLDAAEMETVVLAMKEKVTQPGERIIQQGDDGEELYIVESGSIDCYKKIGDEEKLVKTCNAGDVFGELALLYNCPRAASVQSRDSATLYILDRETFNNIVKEAAQKKRTAYTDFLRKVPLLQNIDEYEIMTIADAMHIKTFDQGTTIIQQGDPGEEFYILAEGECNASKAFCEGMAPVHVMTHKVGDYFGELALIRNEPRAATVKASTTVKLLCMDRKTFKRLLGPIAEILCREATRYTTSSP